MSDLVTTFVAQPWQSGSVFAGTVVDQDSPTTTIAAGSDGAVLPQASIHVAANSLPAAGTVTIAIGAGARTIVYTGGGGTTTLTGCSGGTGTMHTGDVVTGWRVISWSNQWYIHLLAPTSAAGTGETDAYEFGLYSQAVIRGAHTRYTVKLMQDGLYRITYNGSGLATITLPSAIAAELGFTSTPLNLFVGSTGDDWDEGTKPPAHCIMSAYRPVASDGDYQTKPAFAARSKMKSGVVDVLKAYTVSVDRMFGLSDHPRTPSDATTRVTPVTPMYPDENDHARWNSPVATMDTSPGLWTMHRQVHSGDGLRMAYTLGQFQQLAGVSPTVTYYNYGYWTDAASTSKVAVFAPPLISMSKRDGLELTRLATPGTTT